MTRETIGIGTSAFGAPVKRILAVILLTVMGLTLAGCGGYDWRQKLTVEVETPDGVKSASAVTEVSWSENRLFKDGARFQTKFSGEAVTLDLGGGRYMFALLGHSENSEYIGRLAPSIFETTAGLQWGDETFKAAEAATGPIPVPPSLYPMLVTFGDIADPKSVKRVQPSNLAASFGAGHALKSITLEITNEAVTKGVVEGVLGVAR